MDSLITFANAAFTPLISLGAAPVMMVVLTIIAMLVGVKFTKALEGGIKLAIALTGIGSIIGILTGAFSVALQEFVKSTGISLTITDVGWAPLATITWGSPYTLYFLFVMIVEKKAVLHYAIHLQDSTSHRIAVIVAVSGGGMDKEKDKPRS